MMSWIVKSIFMTKYPEKDITPWKNIKLKVDKKSVVASLKLIGMSFS